MRFDFRRVEHHGHALLEEHVVDGPAGQMDRGGLATQDAGAALGVHTAAGRHGEHFRDARGARNRNMLARGQHGFGGDDVGIERSRFRRIDGGVDRADFAQAHLRDGIEQAGIDLQALAVDHLGAYGDFDGGSDIGDFAVLNHDRAIVDRGSGESENLRMGDGVGGGFVLRIRSLREVKES